MMEEQKEELSLQQLISLVEEYAQFLWTKKWWILLVVGVSTSVFFGKQLTKEPVYVASLDFMLNESDGGSLPSILGQFGLGGGGTDGGINQQRVILIGESYPVLSSFLMDSVSVEGSCDRIANHIIQIQELDTSWCTTIATWVNATRRSDSLDIAYNRVMKNLVQYLKTTTDGPVFSVGIDEKANVMQIIFKTKSADLSVRLSTLYYAKLSDRYVQKTVSAKQLVYDILTAKKDSLYGILLATERQYAKSTDRNRGLVLNEDRVPSIDKRRKIEMYNQMYGELITRQQTAEYMLLSNTPLFEVLEYPLLPIGDSNGLNVLSIILCALVAFIFICVFFIGWKLVSTLNIEW
jgi:hypothetical protein